MTNAELVALLEELLNEALYPYHIHTYNEWGPQEPRLELPGDLEQRVRDAIAKAKSQKKDIGEVRWVQQKEDHLKGYCNIGVLEVWKSTMTGGYRWEVHSDPLPEDRSGGVCLTEELAKEAAIRAASGVYEDEFEFWEEG